MIELIPLIIGVLLAQASPGPNLMAVASISLGSGRRAGIATASGVASGVFIWAILFTFGIAALFNAFPQSISAMKFLGGGYLVYLGLKALRSAYNGAAGGIDPQAVQISGFAAYKTGMLVVLTNPKAALMWVAVSAFLASANITDARFLLLGAGVSISALTIYGTYAMLFSTGFAMRTYSGFSSYIEVAFGALFGGVGGKLLFDGFREIRP